MTDPDTLANMLTDIRNHYLLSTPDQLWLSSAAVYLRSLTTLNPVSGLSQTPDQVRAERDMLLMSQDALLRKVKQLQSLNRARLDKLRKLRARIGT